MGHKITIFAASAGDRAQSMEPATEVVKIPLTPARAQNMDIPDTEESYIMAKERESLRISSSLENCMAKPGIAQNFNLIYERYSLWSNAGVKVGRKLGIPCFVEVNAPLLEEQKKYREVCLVSEAEAIARKVFTEADMVLAVSEQVKSYVIAKGASAQRVTVIPNGVDIKRFNPQERPAKLEGLKDKFIVGFSGSLKPWHGLELLLDTFRRLHEDSQVYHLLLVGDGPLRNWIEGYVHGAQLQKAVTMMGWVPYEDLPGLIKSMDVAVAPYPHLEDFYFSPLKLFEYMAVGKPVVASRLGQIQEIIQDGLTGLLARPGDTHDLADKIERLRRDENLRREMGAKACEAAKNHTWEQNAQRIIKAYETII